ncbi:hypothetical protein BC629DRAFT_1531405 [Irpex lacteus]|nr:hypothetical protein BC629DRAFT_1531405 [Irpex lacteus]
MTSYYYPTPRPRASTSDPEPSEPSNHDLVALDVAEPSIYIFPTPPSLPASPGELSSICSALSDFTDFSDTSPRSRSVSFDASTHRNPTTSSYQLLPSKLGTEPWDWAETFRDTSAVQERHWELEEQLGRHGKRDIMSQQLTNEHSLSRSSCPLQTPDGSADRHYHTFLRSRIQSHISDLNSPSFANHSSFTPRPRIRIPLLSFFASLLSIDLDDPTLRLLDQSSPDSILFPGQSNLLGVVGDQLEAIPSEERGESSNSGHPIHHGLLRLLTDGTCGSIAVVRDGLAVICDPLLPLATPFGVPGLSSLRGLGRLIGDTLLKGGQAWQEVHTGDSRLNDM